MGKTCKIVSDDRVFNALETLVHQHVATVIRTRFEAARDNGKFVKVSEYLIDKYNKNKNIHL